MCAHAANGPVKALAVQRPVSTSMQWDGSLLHVVRHATAGVEVEFELPGGQHARGVIRDITPGAEQAHHVAGVLHAPEPGRFFFQRQRADGVAGRLSGVVEFPGAGTAYRVEPATDGGARLVKRRLDEVLCTVVSPPSLSGSASAAKTFLNLAEHPVHPPPDYQQDVPSLESLPGAKAVVFLDFRGGYTPRWQGIHYDRSAFTTAQMREIWLHVAEDFLPFTLNITTDLRVYEAASPTRRQRIIITPTTTAYPNSGGAAYIGSFNWGGDYPAWVFLTQPKDCAEAASHEIGHTLGLQHDGQGGEESAAWSYYYGHASDYMDWGPIMGCAYSSQVSQWSRGEYEHANNPQDDLATIAGENNDIAFREDDAGDTIAMCRWLEISPNGQALGEGVIERPGEVDSFAFETLGGRLNLTANPAALGPNLAMAISLTDRSGKVLVETNDPTGLSASIEAQVPPGTYLVNVKGTGRADPLNTGFSAYGSLGYYSITGLVSAPKLPTRFTVAENAASGQMVGLLSAPTAIARVRFEIKSGSGLGSFSISEAGELRVLDGSKLDFEALSVGKSGGTSLDLFVHVTDRDSGTIVQPGHRVVVDVRDVAEPPPPACVIEPRMTAAGLALRLPSVAHARYQLQTIERFNEGRFWSPLDEKPGVDGTLEFIVPQDTDGTLFRVRAY